MSNPTLHFDPIPSLSQRCSVTVRGDLPGSADVGALAVPVVVGQDPPSELGVDLAALASAGFSGARGQTLVVPHPDGVVRVAVGLGSTGAVDRTSVRDMAAEFARAVPHHKSLAVEVPPATAGLDPADFAQSVTEGVILARWRFRIGAGQDEPALDAVVLVAAEADLAAVREGARRGQVIADAYNLGRDLANCPASTLTAARMAEVAEQLAPDAGLDVESFDKEQLVEMGCGGILGVNMGSAEPPRLIRIRYAPESPTGRLALIGKGIMYDSGGISLKPSDESHAQMKNDMTGASSILATMTTLRALGCTTAVTAYLCCTDNMPSGTAMRLGDILTMRNGKTVEVMNTDAEGRLVMADGLSLAVEEPVDAVVDVATLTGACLRTFGVEIAGLMGNDADLIGQLKAAAETVDEPAWELPLHRAYRSQLDSAVADMTNLGGPNAGSITAGLFLEEFVDGHPWAHLDIASTAQLAAPRTWRNKGASGFGTMLLTEFALAFRPPAGVKES